MARTAKLGKMPMPPKMPLSEAAEYAKKIVGQFGPGEFTDHSLATLFGHETAKSGTFRQRQADLRQYGLIDGRGDKLRASLSAKTITAPGPGELPVALSQTAFRIPLYVALQDKYKGAVPPEEDFLTTLVNLTGLPRSDLMPRLKTLLGLYTDVCRTVGMAPSAPTASPSRSFSGSPPLPSPTGERYATRAPDYEFSMVNDVDVIDGVIEELQAHKKGLQKAIERKLKSDKERGEPKDG